MYYHKTENNANIELDQVIGKYGWNNGNTIKHKNTIKKYNGHILNTLLM